MKTNQFDLCVNSETGRLRSLIIHSPDSGIGKVAPSKAQDWLFEDILHLQTVREKEYDYYVKILLYFLDPQRIKGKLSQINSKEARRSFFKPAHPQFHSSERVIEFEQLLAGILERDDIRQKLTASVCAIEGCSYLLQERLSALPAADLSAVFISGSLPDTELIFPPVPNLIFTRDIGIVINNFILLNKPAKKARARETLLARYVFFNHPLFRAYRDNIIEIPGTTQYFLRPGEDYNEKTTIEGGDVMVVSPGHILIGCSERTSASGASETIKLLFERDVIRRATVIKIPPKRDFMHIDTVFTQVDRGTWVILKSISSLVQNTGSEPIDYLSGKRNLAKPEIIQFEKGNMNNPRRFDCVEELLAEISENELGSKGKTRFIYSGNDQFPFDIREQWTDSCNLLALREGVVLGYDRNDRTVEAFKENGFSVIHAPDLVDRLESGELDADTMHDTLILIPSGELSRARGGFHCMSMPLFRDHLE